MDLSPDLDTLKALAKLMNDAGLHEIDLEDKEVRIHLRRGDAEKTSVSQLVSAVPAFAPSAASSQSSPAAPAAAAAAKPAPPPGTREIKSPMVGTFYRAPSPDAPPFCEEGDKVTEESVLCIIEAMKVMNEIKADCRGDVAKILVANGESVEYGQPLFLVKVG